jgi:pyruvate formate lyase activating enzyme
MRIRDIQPSLIEWDGNLTNIVFTYGCNWRCKFCFQKDLLKTPDILLSKDTVLSRLKHDRDKFGIDHVEIIGGEPTLQPDLYYFVRDLYDLHLKVMIATNGSRPTVIQEILPYVDYFAIDYKTTFKEYSNLIQRPFYKEHYLESIRYAKQKDYLIRTTYLKGYHDKLIDEMAQELKTFTDPEHYRVQLGIYEGTLDPTFKFDTSTAKEAKAFESKIKEKMI